jgi:TonB family protein
MDSGALPGETETGEVKHNRRAGAETGGFPFQEETQRPEAREPAAHMANNPLIQPETESPAAAAIIDGCELDLAFGVPVREIPIWSGLYESLRDVFFPPQLPPLELTSTPIPVPDRMAVRRNPWAIGIAASVNLAILAVALFFGVRKIVDKVKPPLTATTVDLTEFKAPKASTQAGGGGGGGDHSAIQASKGKLPKLEKTPITPPQVQRLDKPKLAMPSAINVQKNLTLPDNPLLPNIGLKNSTNVKLASNGQGGGGGMGTGYGGGIGPGSGNGYGPGSGGNTGGGLFHIGGAVSAPVLVHSVDPEFSDEARRAKFQGVCLISIIVDAQGNPLNPRVVRPLGMGLDEKAIAAIKQFRFRPAMKDGKTAVPVALTVEINFRLY